MKTASVIVWDLDGTLIETSRGVLLSIEKVAREAGLHEVTLQEKKRLLGIAKIKQVFEEIFQVPSNMAEEYATKYRQYYLENFLFKAELYPGVLQLLDACQRGGVTSAVCTNKGQEHANRLCEYFGISKFFSAIVGDNSLGGTKAGRLKLCLEKLGVTSSAGVAMIGDTMEDANAADANKIPFIGVNYGYGFRNVPEYANSPKEILSCIERINHDNVALKP